MLKPISPQDAARRMQDGARLIDVREADEHARERIPGARSVPLSKLQDVAFGEGQPLLFHCRSGARTIGNAVRLAQKAGECEAFLVEGGLDAWKHAGLPMQTDHRQPLELMRQVQIAAGSMVLAGVILGAAVSPWFYALSGFVGAGLVFAGVTGTCGLAHLLSVMPWNRPAATQTA